MIFQGQYFKKNYIFVFCAVCVLMALLIAQVPCLADEPPVPAPAFIIKSAQYDCAVSGDSFQGRISISVQSLQDAWTEIPVLPVSTIVTEFAVPDGAYFLRGKDLYNLLVEKKGLYQITASFILPVEKQDELRRVNLPITSAAMADVNIKVDGKDIEFQTVPAVETKIVDNGGAYSLNIRPAFAQALALSWYPAALKNKFRPAFTVETVSEIMVENRLVSAVERLNAVFPAEGKKELVLEFKSKSKITLVEGDDISGWFAKDNEFGGMSLNLKFQRAVTGKRSIVIRTETILDADSFSIVAAPAVVLEAKSQQGIVRIYTDRDINILEQEKEFMERVEYPSGQAFRPVFSYNYSDPRAVARFTAQPKLPVIHVTSEMLAGIEYDGFMEMTCRLDFNVKEVEIGSISMDIPADCSVTAVKGDDVLKWDMKNSTLNIALKNRKQGLIPVQLFMEKSFAPQSEWEFPVIKSQGVLVWEGAFAIKANPEIFVSTVKTANLVQINVQELPEWLRNSAPSQAYRFISPNYSLISVITPVQPKISSAFVAYFIVNLDSIYGSITAEYTIEKRGIFFTEIKIPNGFSVTDVVGANIKDWFFRDDQQVVKINFDKAAINANKIAIEIEKKLAADESVLQFESPYAMQNNSKYEALMIFGSDEDVKIAPDGDSTAHELSIYKLPEKIRSRYQDVNYAFRFNESGGRLKFVRERLIPQIEAQIYNAVSVRKGLYSVQSLIYYKISNARTNRLEISVPENAVNSELNGAFIKSKTLAGNIWVVELATKIKGSYMLDIKYESNISDKDGKCAAGFPRPAGAGKITGYVIAGKIRQGDELAEINKALLQAVEPSTMAMPAEFTKLLPATALYYYGYNDPEALLSLQIKEHIRQDIMEAKIEYCELNTLLRKDGELVTMLTAEVANTSKQTIFVTLPNDGILWGAYINNKPVKPVSAKGGYKIPVFAEKKAGSGAVKFELALLWGGVTDEGLNGKINLVPPEFDVEIEDIKWGVYLPKGYNVVGNTEDMKIFYRDPAAIVPSLGPAVYTSIERYYSVLRDFSPKWLPSAVLYIITGAVIILLALIAVKILLLLWSLLLSIRLTPVRVGFGIIGLFMVCVVLVLALVPFSVMSSKSVGGGGGGGEDYKSQMAPENKQSSVGMHLTGDNKEILGDEVTDRPAGADMYYSHHIETDNGEEEFAQAKNAEGMLANSPADDNYMYDSIGIGGGYGEKSSGKRRLDNLKKSPQDRKKLEEQAAKVMTETERQKEKDKNDLAFSEGDMAKKPQVQQAPAKPAEQLSAMPGPKPSAAPVPAPEMSDVNILMRALESEEPQSSDTDVSGVHVDYKLESASDQQRRIISQNLYTTTRSNINSADLSRMSEIYSNTFNPTTMGRAKGVFPIAVNVPTTDMNLFAFEMPYKGAGVSKLGIYCFGTGILLFLQLFACAVILVVSIAVARHATIFAFILNVILAIVFFFTQSMVSPVYEKILGTAFFFAVFLCIVFFMINIAGQFAGKYRLNKI
ncbi:MAG: hypothetical protein HZA48_02155 [Planctomycetes bacterium]|nr:hypothetical protein [Planctomycetota bacterium]